MGVSRCRSWCATARGDFTVLGPSPPDPRREARSVGGFVAKPPGPGGLFGRFGGRGWGARVQYGVLITRYFCPPE